VRVSVSVSVSVRERTSHHPVEMKERPGYDSEPAPRLYSKRYLPGQNIHPGNCATGKSLATLAQLISLSLTFLLV
jgi:hypothetical protein